jgi:hypothetical protein
MEIWIITQPFPLPCAIGGPELFGPPHYVPAPLGVGQSTLIDTEGRGVDTPPSMPAAPPEQLHCLQRHCLLDLPQVIEIELNISRTDHAVHLLGPADADDSPGDRGIP